MTTQTKQTLRRPHLPATFTKAEAERFKARGWCNVSFVGPLDAVAKGLGDMEGIAPIMPQASADSPDKVTSAFDKASPTGAQGMLFRLWFETKADAKRFLVELPAFFATNATKMRGGWYGLNLDVDLLTLQIEMLEFAKTKGLSAFDDDDAIKLLAQATAQAA